MTIYDYLDKHDLPTILVFLATGAAIITFDRVALAWAAAFQTKWSVCDCVPCDCVCETCSANEDDMQAKGES